MRFRRFTNLGRCRPEIGWHFLLFERDTRYRWFASRRVVSSAHAARRRIMIDIDRPFLNQDPFNQNVRSGIEGSGVGTWDFEFSTQQLTWSNTTRKLFGVSPEAPVDYDLFLSLLYLQDRDRTAAAVQKSIHTGCNFDAQCRVHRHSDAG